MRSNKEKVAVNMMSSVSLTIVKMLFSFATRIIFLMVLNESYLGISALFTNVIGVLSLADLGLSSVMTFSLYKPLAEQDEDRLASLVWYFRKVYLAIAAVVFVAGVSLVPFLPYVINLEEEIPYINLYYMISLMSTVISYLCIYRGLLMSADQKQYVMDGIGFVFRVIMFVLNVVALLVFRNYILYLMSTFVVSLCNNIAINIKAKKMYPFLKSKAKPITAQDKASIKENVKSLFVYKFSAALVNNVDNILTSVLVSTVMVGLYSNYVMMITHVSTFVNTLFTQIIAMLGNVLALERDNVKRQIVMFENLAYINFWLIGFCSVSFYVLFNDFIALVFGAQYLLSDALVFVVVLSFYISNMRRCIGAFQDTLGMFKDLKYITLVTAIINVVLSVIFGMVAGLVGILFATSVANLLYGFWREPLILYHKYFKASSKSYFINYIIKMLLVVFATAVTVWCSSFVTLANAYLAFACKLLLCLVVPNVVFLVCTFKTKEFVYTKNNLAIPAAQKVLGRIMAKR